MHGLVLGAFAASLLVIARRRWQRDVVEDAAAADIRPARVEHQCRTSTRGKPPLPSVETPPRAETPRKALLGGDDELWEEQREEHGKSRRRPCTPPPLIHRGFANAEEALPRLAGEAVEEVARLKAQLEQLAFENESLHNLNESLNESLHTAAERKRTEASPSPGMLTGATEEASSVDRAPLATTRPSLASPAADERTAHVTATASGSPPAGLAVDGRELAGRLFRAHARVSREGTLRLCLCAMRQHAVRRTAERRFQGLLALKVVEVEEAQAEAQVTRTRTRTLTLTLALAPTLALSLTLSLTLALALTLALSLSLSLSLNLTLSLTLTLAPTLALTLALTPTLTLTLTLPRCARAAPPRAPRSSRCSRASRAAWRPCTRTRSSTSTSSPRTCPNPNPNPNPNPYPNPNPNPNP